MFQELPISLLIDCSLNYQQFNYHDTITSVGEGGEGGEGSDGSQWQEHRTTQQVSVFMPLDLSLNQCHNKSPSLILLSTTCTGRHTLIHTQACMHGLSTQWIDQLTDQEHTYTYTYTHTPTFRTNCRKIDSQFKWLHCLHAQWQKKSVELFSLPYLSKPQNHGMIFIDCTAAHLKFQTSHQTKAKLLFSFFLSIQILSSARGPWNAFDI